MTEMHGFIVDRVAERRAEPNLECIGIKPAPLARVSLLKGRNSEPVKEPRRFAAPTIPV